MEFENIAKVMEVSKICPSSSSSLPSTFSLPLTDFDWMFLRCPPLECLLFYPLSNDSFSLFESIIIPNLKLSLSLTLQHFFPLAGALVWPDDSPLPYILYSRDDAVCFTLAESLADFQTLSSPNPLEIGHLRSLLPSMSDYAAIPMCAIQVTHFPNHGYSIGFSTHHLLVDGKSFNLILKSWAHICNKLNHQQATHNLPRELIPCLDRNNNDMISNPLDFVPKDRNISYFMDALSPYNWQRATMNLNQNHIEKLKSRALEYWTTTTTTTTTKEELHLSSFVVAYAHALVCLAKTKGEDGCKDKFLVGVTADARLRLSPPISTNYFGNCMVNKNTLVGTRELREDENGFSIVAKKIGDLILELNESDGVEKPKPYKREFKHGEEFEACVSAWSPKYKVYETDFGWGNPKQAELFPLLPNTFMFMDSTYGAGGVQLLLSLPTHQMDVFHSLFFKI